MLWYKRRIPGPSYLSFDFEMGSEKKFRRKLLDRETDGVRSVRKTSVPNWLSPRFPIAAGEKLRLSAVIESDLGFFDHKWVCHLIISNKNSKYPLNSPHTIYVRNVRK